MRSRFNSIEGNKIRTIRMTKYVPGNDGQMIPTWMTVEEVYQCLRDHLEDVGMLPDEYFNINSSIRKNCSLKAYYYTLHLRSTVIPREYSLKLPR